MNTDLVLSSGYLAFARHAGFLQAIEEADVQVDAFVGTSSGALTGSLWCAGYSSGDLLAELTASSPISRIGFHLPMWKGIFTMKPVIAHLRTLLPATFAELSRPFGVGVADPKTGEHVLLTEGDLPAAVAASCAVPTLFKPVFHGERAWMDGGAVDRVALEAWRTWRPERPGLVHIIDRSRGPASSADLGGLTVVRSPRSGASLLSLKDVVAQREESLGLARAALASF